MIHDPSLALHTIKQSQQEHRDIATSHRLARAASPQSVDEGRSVRSVRRVGTAPRLLRLRRPAAPVGLPHRLSTP